MKWFLKVKIYLLIWYLKNYYGYTNVSTRALYAQAWHETGGFTSPVFLQNNNLFGMRLPKKRETYATGSNLNHATFKNHYDSIRDYFKRQKSFRIPNVSDSQYMTLTQQSGYAEDKKYIEKWKNVTKTVKIPLNISTLMLFFLVVVVIRILMSLLKSKPSDTKNEIKIYQNEKKQQQFKYA